ncbi:MAG: nuclear transport factor 2 family protein [Roseococcus sp.]|nr:nuclear transport factor 2 family protein [Roseococcus sp.]
MRDTREVALAFTALLRAGKGPEAGEAFWHEDVSSIEATGAPRAAHGIAAVRGKAGWWLAHHEVHALEVQGPFVNEDQFALFLRMEVSLRATGERRWIEEIGLYTVLEGRIVEERFFA